VLSGEIVLRDQVIDVHAIDLLGFRFDLPQLGSGRRDEREFFANSLARSFGVRDDFLRRNQETVELGAEDLFEIVDGNFVAAGLTDVLGRVRPHVHLGPAFAVREPGEEMDRTTPWAREDRRGEAGLKLEAEGPTTPLRNPTNVAL
jgi:hypothetical protein